MEWQPIETKPSKEQGAGRGYLITWYDTDDTFEDGTWGPDSIEFTCGYVGIRDGKHCWWNMNSGNILHFRYPPTHWSWPPKPTTK